MSILDRIRQVLSDQKPFAYINVHREFLREIEQQVLALRDAAQEARTLRDRLETKANAYTAACRDRTRLEHENAKLLNENADLRARHSPCQADVDRLQFRLDEERKQSRKHLGMYRVAAKDREKLRLRLNESEEALSGYRRDWAETSDQLQAERERVNSLSEINRRQEREISSLKQRLFTLENQASPVDGDSVQIIESPRRMGKSVTAENVELCKEVSRYKGRNAQQAKTIEAMQRHTEELKNKIILYSAYMRGLMDYVGKPDDYSADVVDPEAAHKTILDGIERNAMLKERLVDANTRLREIGGLAGGEQ